LRLVVIIILRNGITFWSPDKVWVSVLALFFSVVFSLSTLEAALAVSRRLRSFLYSLGARSSMLASSSLARVRADGKSLG